MSNHERPLPPEGCTHFHIDKFESVSFYQWNETSRIGYFSVFENGVWSVMGSQPSVFGVKPQEIALYPPQASVKEVCPGAINQEEAKEWYLLPVRPEYVAARSEILDRACQDPWIAASFIRKGDLYYSPANGDGVVRFAGEGIASVEYTSGVFAGQTRYESPLTECFAEVIAERRLENLQKKIAADIPPAWNLAEDLEKHWPESSCDWLASKGEPVCFVRIGGGDWPAYDMSVVKDNEGLYIPIRGSVKATPVPSAREATEYLEAYYAAELEKEKNCRLARSSSASPTDGPQP